MGRGGGVQGPVKKPQPDKMSQGWGGGGRGVRGQFSASGHVSTPSSLTTRPRPALPAPDPSPTPPVRSLFEPSMWQSAEAKPCPAAIPTPDRVHLATPCGLLFNELQRAPQTVAGPVEAMLANVLDKDTGRYSSTAAALILYVVRLAVRVQGFMLFLLQYNRQLAEAEDAGRFMSHVRGLECTPDVLQVRHQRCAESSAYGTGVGWVGGVV